VDAREILIIARNWGRTHATQRLSAPVKETMSILHGKHSVYVDAYRAMYEMLDMADISDNPEGTLKLKDTLSMLIKTGVEQQIPDKTLVLQNYPNPFNPETWIPYALSSRTYVVIKIYNISGQLIRTLDIGMKDAGMYISPERAAYWDGKNDEGEEVASGVYVYQLHAGDNVKVKKMVVIK
jgi:hypothetical protein